MQRGTPAGTDPFPLAKHPDMRSIRSFAPSRSAVSRCQSLAGRVDLVMTLQQALARRPLASTPV
jgi:hypothetical protein